MVGQRVSDTQELHGGKGRFELDHILFITEEEFNCAFLQSG